MLANPALKMEFLEELNFSKAITLNLFYMFLSLLSDIHRRMERRLRMDKLEKHNIGTASLWVQNRNWDFPYTKESSALFSRDVGCVLYPRL